jgi:hypothetical protein
MPLYLRDRFPEQKSPMYFFCKHESGGESRIIYDTLRVAHCRAEGRLYKLLLQCQELCHRFVTDIVLEFALQVSWNKFAPIKLENGKVKSGKLPLNYLGANGLGM